MGIKTLSIYDTYEFHDGYCRKNYKVIDRKDKTMCGWISKKCIDKKKAKIVKKKSKGFTLIELMIVIAIISILLTIAIPQFQRIMNGNDGKSEVQIEENHIPDRNGHQGQY